MLDLLTALVAPFCHQLADRSLCIEGSCAAICARCLGLYLAFGLRMLLPAPGLGVRLLVLVTLALIWSAVDALFLADSAAAMRVVTGAIGGWSLATLGLLALRNRGLPVPSPLRLPDDTDNRLPTLLVAVGGAMLLALLPARLGSPWLEVVSLLAVLGFLLLVYVVSIVVASFVVPSPERTRGRWALTLGIAVAFLGLGHLLRA